MQGIWQKINYQKNKIKGSDNIIDKAKAVVFVDYEYLHITFEKVFSRELDFDFLKKKLEEMYDLVAIVTFADFTCESFSRVLHKIRDFSTFVNECANPLAFSKKDYTDSILSATMMENAFKKTFNNDTFVLVTGDGHFSQTVSLVKRLGYKVDVIGFDFNLSKVFKPIANNVHVIYKNVDNFPTFDEAEKNIDEKNVVKKETISPSPPLLSSLSPATKAEEIKPIFNNFKSNTNLAKKEKRREHKEIRDRIKNKYKDFESKKISNNFKSKRNQIFARELDEDAVYLVDSSTSLFTTSSPPLDVTDDEITDIKTVVNCIKGFTNTAIFPIEKFIVERLERNFDLPIYRSYIILDKMVEYEYLVWQDKVLDNGKQIEYADLNYNKMFADGIISET